MFLIQHLPALQVLIPFISALIVVVSNSSLIAWLIVTLSTILLLALNIYGLPEAIHGISYAFGDWPAPIGIEYKLDSLNQPIIVFVNFVLLFFLTFGKKMIDATILKYIKESKRHLFYSMLLFAHAGYIGILSTNDIFNLYVFIEISSLSTYVLMSMGKNPFSLIGAFDYLVLGTIGATLILISIGFFLALTGSLNITDIASILNGSYNSKIIITAIVFFLTGAMLKMAFFPMHFWMIRAYSSTSTFILTYISSISSLIGIYMITRFVFFTINGAEVEGAITTVLRPLAMIAIVICTFLALRSDDFKNVVVYSTASQVGYIFLLMTIWSANELMFSLIILDSLNKIALFTIITHLESKNSNLKFADFKHIEKSGFFKLLVTLSLLFSASLPLTSMFLVKVQMFEILLQKKLFAEFVVVIAGSVLALLYHFRLGSAIFFVHSERGIIQLNGRYYGLAAIVIVQTLTIFYINDLLSYSKFTL